MKTRNLTTIILLILALLTVVGIFYYDYTIRTNSSTEIKEDDIESIKQLYTNDQREEQPIQSPDESDQASDRSPDKLPQVEPKPDTNISQPEPIQSGDQLKYTAWIPSWGHTAGVASLQKQPEIFGSISPVWYSPTPDGSLDIKFPSGYKTFLQFCKDNDIRVIPSIAMFDAEVLTQILNSNTNFSRHINQIIDQVAINDFDGIDIDYEMIYLSDKDRFLTFVDELSTRLQKDNKILSITILAQWGDNVIYPSLKETRAVQELELIGKLADEVRIMTYDYTPNSSREPGPIAPIDWMENVLKYTVTKIPSEKIWLGTHLYGYEWISTGGVSATTFSDLSQLRSIEDFQVTHNYTYNEGVANYTCATDLKCTLFFQDQKGIEARRSLAEKYQIAGLAFWRLGDEADLLTPLLSD